MSKTAKPGFDFTLTHRVENGNHFLTVSPSKGNDGYPSKEIEITEGQWNDLRYHFAQAVDDKNKIEKLTYIY